MKNLFLATVILLAVAFGTSAGTLTQLYSNGDGTGNCTPGAIVACNYSGWFSNGTEEINKASTLDSYISMQGDLINVLHTSKVVTDAYTYGDYNGMSFSGDGWSHGYQLDYTFVDTQSHWNDTYLYSDGELFLSNGQNDLSATTNGLDTWNVTCDALGNCTRDDWYTSVTDNTYTSSGYWQKFLDGMYQSGDNWSFDWANQYGDTPRHTQTSYNANAVNGASTLNMADTTTLQQQVGAVPEPSSMGMGVIGVLFAGALILRRRSGSA
jgi:hypothetical protein